MILALGMTGMAAAGALLGAALTLRLAGRHRVHAGQLVGQVRQLRSDVAELGLLYALPAGTVRDDHPRAAVSRL
jgi:hypothetical protein